MFSGIVEELGRVVANDGAALTIAATTVVSDCHIGDSIAVNGACLTVVAFNSAQFTVDVVPETLRRTNLGAAHPGDPVNLERSLAANGRVGGHFVQGHIDGTGMVLAIEPEQNGVMTRFGAPPQVARYLVTKGFVAIDGVSLTVVDVGDVWFSVALIPHTREHTTLGVRAVGDAVNLEADILGKYVERFVRSGETANEWLAAVTA